MWSVTRTRLHSLHRIHCDGRRLLSGSPHVRNGGKYQKIADAYAGKSVFVTGGTGFIGKVLIERLLYNCKDIKNIYVLIRQKKGVPPEKRLEGMFDLPIFSKLKESRPQDLNKVIPVQGDMLKLDLGVQESDQKILEQNVAMVFHLGANVMFKESLKNLIDANCGGTRNVMSLSRKMKKLEVFVYFSTIFSHLRPFMDEVLYPLPVATDVIEQCVRSGDSTRLEKQLNSPLYTLSKGLAESQVDEERGSLPMIMIRPSAVTATMRDPIVGWVESWIAQPSFFLEHSKGLITVARGYNDVVCDIIPCDYVCNLAIVAAARGNSTKDMIIYHSCTSSTNPITWKYACDMFRQSAKESGKWELRPKELVLTTSPLAVYILTLLRDRIPALLGDLILRIKGEEPRYIAQQKRSIFIRNSVDVATATSVFFKSTRPLLLAQTLDEEDKVRFQFDTNTINWSEYIPSLHKSVYKYMLNKNKNK